MAPKAYHMLDREKVRLSTVVPPSRGTRIFSREQRGEARSVAVRCVGGRRRGLGSRAFRLRQLCSRGLYRLPLANDARLWFRRPGLQTAGDCRRPPSQAER
jgi:hypothetical protein